MREVSAVQSSKWLKLTDILSKPLLDFSPMVSTKLVGRHKSPVLWRATWLRESAEQQRWAEYSNGV